MNLPIFDAHPSCTACDLHSECRKPGLPSRVYTPDPSVRGDNPVVSSEAQTRCLFVLGHQPGLEEDKQGAVHVGASGTILTRAYLEGSGLPYLAHVYLGNVTRCFPSVYKKVQVKHAAACWPHIEKDFDLLNALYPHRFLLLLGTEAARFFHKYTTHLPIASLKEAQKKNGTQVKVRDYDWTVFATTHPANLLSGRSPSLIVSVRDHLDFLARAVALPPPKPSLPMIVEPGPPPEE